MIPQKRTTRQIIRSFEAKALKKRSLTIRVADHLSSYFGSINFLLINIAFFAAWILANLGYLRPLIEPFDPYPFVLLITAVSLEAIFLSVVVLISQNRQSYISSVRDELILQTNLIAERELTKVLELLAELHKHHGVKTRVDPELEAMLHHTDISYIERKLEEQLQPVQPKPFQKIVEVMQKPITVNGNGKGK